MSVIGILTGLAAAGTSIYNAVQQNRTNKQSIYETEKARQFQEYMQDKMNLYNTPSEQMARLQAAGLNPNLIYDNQGVMPAANVGSQPSPNLQSPYLANDIYNAILQNKQLSLQERIADANIEKIEAETGKILEATKTETYLRDKVKSETEKINKEISRYDKITDIYLLNEEMKLNLASQDFQFKSEMQPFILINQQVQNEKILNDIKNDNMRLALEELLNGAKIEDIKSRVNLNYQQFEFLETYNKCLINAKRLDIVHQHQQIKLKDYDIKLSKENTDTYNTVLRYVGGTLNVIGQAVGIVKPFHSFKPIDRQLPYK